MAKTFMYINVDDFWLYAFFSVYELIAVSKESFASNALRA